MGKCSKALVSCVVAGLSVVGFSVPSSAVVSTTALVYGDSLTFESRSHVVNEVTAHAGWAVAVHAYPNTAPCDWIPWLAGDLAVYQPSIFAIETVGNYARPCMVDPQGVALVPGSTSYYTKLQDDLATIMQIVHAAGAQIVFVNGPPMLDAAWNARVKKINAVGRSLARQLHGVGVSGKPRSAVSTGGQYATYKTCLSNETSAMGCVNGQIAIRTLTGIQTGIHFCPDGLGPNYPFACDMYSSGEYRWGKAIGQVLIAPPAPFLP